MSQNKKNKIYFIINDDRVEVEGIDDEIYNQLSTDDEYAIIYVQQLIEEKFLTLDAPLNKLIRVENGKETDLFKSRTSNIQKQTDGEWTAEETKLLLDKYETYLDFIGPMKKFKTKKRMWAKISEDIKTILNTEKDATQCENRYKTILKRKKKAVDNNKQSGSSRKTIEYENELKKIAAKDDSIEPEALCGVGRIISKEYIQQSGSSRESTPVTPEEHYTPKSKKRKTVSDTFIAIQREKEENKERRHQEKMEMMRTLIEALKKDQ